MIILYWHMTRKRPKRNSPTLREIAKRANVSLPTVSHVLGNRASLYRETTCLRVTKAAEDLGYRPNSAAKAIVNGCFNALAILASVQGNRSYLPDSLLGGVYSAAEAAGVNLILSKFPDEQLTSERFVPRLLLELMVDGLLINYINEVPLRLVEMIKQYAIPSVWINCKRQNDCVHPNDLEAGRQATAHLLELGHRKIAYIDFAGSGHYSAKDRFEGYAEIMRNAGLTPCAFCPEEIRSPRDALKRSLHILEAPDRPTAIVACGPEHAVAMLRAAEHKQLQLPRDLSLVTFADSPTEDHCLSITTLRIPLHEMGRLATEMLITKIRHGKSTQPEIVVPFAWEAGESCTPPKPVGVAGQ
jgi:LacI family transcriptional regulator